MHRCQIPICNDCWHVGRKNDKIPGCLVNDNFSGYAHEFIVAVKVTWLEATIAAPVFSGIVTYYVEGRPVDHYNLMDTPLGKAHHSWSTRGNLFSFLLPFEKILTQLFQKVEDGDLSEWPLSSKDACTLVRVKFVRADPELVQEFRDLYVRSAVVKRLVLKGC